MNGKQLRNSILQWAIQGKLVPQDSNDEPSSVLLDKIRKEKEHLVREGKLKKDKQESIIYRGEDGKYYERIGKTIKCIDEEIPFEIPQGWEWTRIIDVIQVNPKNKVNDETISAFIPMEKIQATYKSEYTYDKVKWGDIKKGFTHFADGDVCFAKITPCFQNRKSAILENLPNGIGAGTTELKVLRPFGDTINRWFILYFLKSSYFIDEAKFKGTANQQRILAGYLEYKLFPLPPLNEQQRIVKKLEELLPLIDRYEKAQEGLDKINAELKDKLKASILQEAIQGKLVPQDSNDEPAAVLLDKIRKEKEQLVREGKLKKDKQESIIYRGEDGKYYERIGKDIKCIDEEIPFEISQGWEWCRLGTIVMVGGGKRIPAGRTLTTENTGHKYIRVTDMKNNTIKTNDIHYISKDIYQQIKSYTISKNDLYITVAGTIGAVGNVPIEFDNANLTENADKLVFTILNKKFLMYALLSDTIQSQIRECTTKVGQPKLAIKRIQNFLIPLPPLNEQQRIVEKLELLFAQLDKMKIL